MLTGGPFNIPVGNGYLFSSRGDKTTANPYTSTTVPIASTLTAAGTLNQGTITVRDWFSPSVSNFELYAEQPGRNHRIQFGRKSIPKCHRLGSIQQQLKHKSDLRAKYQPFDFNA